MEIRLKIFKNKISFLSPPCDRLPSPGKLEERGAASVCADGRHDGGGQGGSGQRQSGTLPPAVTDRSSRRRFVFCSLASCCAGVPPPSSDFFFFSCLSVGPSACLFVGRWVFLLPFFSSDRACCLGFESHRITMLRRASSACRTMPRMMPP